MTTGVYVDIFLNCFFSCKDRASERDRPCWREKSPTCVVWLKSELWKRAATPRSCFHMVAEPWNLYRIADTKVVHKIADVDTG